MQNPQPFLPPTGPQHGQAPAPAAAADGAGHAGQHDGPLPDIFSADRSLDAAAPAFTPEHHQQGHLSIEQVCALCTSAVCMPVRERHAERRRERRALRKAPPRSGPSDANAKCKNPRGGKGVIKNSKMSGFHVSSFARVAPPRVRYTPDPSFRPTATGLDRTRPRPRRRAAAARPVRGRAACVDPHSRAHTRFGDRTSI
jgi:hypothetical protein